MRPARSLRPRETNEASGYNSKALESTGKPPIPGCCLTILPAAAGQFNSIGSSVLGHDRHDGIGIFAAALDDRVVAEAAGASVAAHQTIGDDADAGFGVAVLPLAGRRTAMARVGEATMRCDR